MIANAIVLDTEVADTDEWAQLASENPLEFERLLLEFKPFLWKRVSRLAGCSFGTSEDLMSAAEIAFYEAVTRYNRQKGHFIPYMNTVVHMRLIDSLRKMYAERNYTLSLDNNEDNRYLPLIDESAINAHREAETKYYLKVEIECLKEELAEWNITLPMLIEHSPKHLRLREIYKNLTGAIADNAEIMQIIFTKHYFPIRKISIFTKVPEKIIERGRIYLLAAIMIRTGDYEQLKEYVN